MVLWHFGTTVTGGTAVARRFPAVVWQNSGGGGGLGDGSVGEGRPVPLSVGFVSQYVLKPLLGVLVANAFGMPRTFYAGFVLTCCVAGAQLSSYASSLSKADVAMSILLTSATTIASVLFTPLLSGLLIGSVVPVDAVAISKSILQVVLVPVTLGLVLNTYAKPLVTVIQPVMSFVAMVCTSLCIGSPLSINHSQILSAEGLGLIIPIVTFHAVAFVLGYWFSKIPGLRQEEEVSRTISLCTGMQSSTLAGLLASQFLGSSQAVPTQQQAVQTDMTMNSAAPPQGSTTTTTRYCI
ncbi:PREDICTED: probable sodium/metabolite cotransporter BASS3, chloroplastic [Camelina sativa]|uniref:Probable sodium/metabolite cotransporter BASS3, chloroplastic n=1 Tax=Camelina sativa TaxID=90675 RepID=A0ABM0Y4A8_CAMSA|nr:PREDICTED: probable sodium/metabolite cotransporter BASS3, chloroplastic [Camelina sativa]